jgi:hypothetical protein
MLSSVSLCRLIAEIRDFQDGQDCGVLADAAKMNLADQPPLYRSAARLAGSDLTTRNGKGCYRPRT